MGMELDEWSTSDAPPRSELIRCVAGLSLSFIKQASLISGAVKCSQEEFSVMVCAYWLEFLQHVFSYKAS